MKRSRHEVGRWRMLRQSLRRRRRWLEGHSRRNMHIYSLRKIDIYKRRRSLLFTQWNEWGH
ncbi:YciY family protein [Providencia stuartii]|uniref:Uncharacterized protein YciY n=2 Tax=Providencia TaxID=586 RepID=A0AAI9D8S5_PROST|nr:MULTISPECIES: YciY family protein [Providencia]MDV5224481.1 YciY family protein [Providencia rettgeri]ELR5039252.1 YciY family protein [Providencia stuartii]ELR5080364.1 YciY family protein [Providencia stuartii]ELR5111316.1 YciY family protein [Providencia stuartii]ELR5298528.1 YciY family protein [Providencia stuartii]